MEYYTLWRDRRLCTALENMFKKEIWMSLTPVLIPEPGAFDSILTALGVNY